jgi:hypothetical protein
VGGSVVVVVVVVVVDEVVVAGGRDVTGIVAATVGLSAGEASHAAMGRPAANATRKKRS